MLLSLKHTIKKESRVRCFDWEVVQEEIDKA
jgi:hypothetical protein